MEPKLANKRDLKWRKWFVFALAPAILVLAIGLSFFKQCTALGRAAEPDVYDPNACGAGFVSKADSVFALLLADECINQNVQAISLDSLNQRYKALEFALPFREEGNAYIESTNLRLVGIHPEYIKDESLRRFYYNSRLPQLIEQQNQHLGESLFEIRCKSLKPAKGTLATNPSQVRPIEIESIKMIPSMFKVRLVKNLWTGVIESRQNCIFEDDSTIYLTYGNSVLPIHSDTAFAQRNPIYFNAIMNEGILMWTPPERVGRSHVLPDTIDYYKYYKAAFDNHDRTHTICLRLQENRSASERAHMTFTYADGKLNITHTCGLMVVGGKQSTTYLNNVRAGDHTEVPFEDGMKILMYTVANNKLSEKLGEITLCKQNPMRMLSYLTQTSVGADRFFISDYQTDLFTQQLLRGLSQHLSNRKNVDTVKLTIDPLLSREFENEIKRYVAHLPGLIDTVRDVKKPASQVNEQYDMSVTIMDLATGEVLATPFYTTLFEKSDFPEQLKLTTRNASLCRRSIGSTFKPMEALASVLAMPSLVNLNTTGRYGPPDFEAERVTFFGRPTKPWAKKSASQWNGCDFTTFLSQSDDIYPVSLVALALSGESANATTTTLPVGDDAHGNSYFALKDRNETSRDQVGFLRFKKESETRYPLEKQPFVHNLSHLFNININERSDDDRYRRTTDIDLFKQLVSSMNNEKNDRIFGLREVSPELTQLHFDRFDDGEDFHDLLMPWVLGQGDNMWNCVKLAEAWARMIGKRDVRATFISHTDNASKPSLVDETLMSFTEHQNFNATWNAFLEKFHDAQQGGTLMSMREAVLQMGEGLTLFSKTGTPNAYNPPIDFALLGGRLRKMDLGMYSFVLVKNEQYSENILNNRPAKGIVCIVRVARTYECQNCRPGKPCEPCDRYWGLESAHARDFFAKNSARLRKLYDMTRNYF